MGRETYFPHLAILVPKRQSCACLRGQYTLRKITRHSNQVPRLNLRSARGTAGAPRDFVPWRFLDAGRHSAWKGSSCRRPKTCTATDSCSAANRVVIRSLRRRARAPAGRAVLHLGFPAGWVRAAGEGERHEDLQEQLKPPNGGVFLALNGFVI